MPRIFTSGLESGDYTTDFTVFAGVPSTNTGTVRTGIYSLRLNTATSAVQSPIISTGTTILGGFAYNLSLWNLGGGNNNIFEIYNIGGNLGGIRRMTTSVGNVLGVNIGDVATTITGTIAIPLNSWVYIEYCIMIDNSTGTFQTKINGIPDISFFGDTQASSESIIHYFRLREPQAGVSAYFDDIVVNSPAGDKNNSWPGVIRLHPIRPNAMGDVTQLTQGGTTGSSNYGQVDDEPLNTADYIYGYTVNNYDLYNLQDPTLPANVQIKNVIVNNVAALESGSGNLAGMIKSGGAEAQGSDHSLSISYENIQDVFPVDPSITGTWSASAMTNLQIGPKIR